MTTVAKFIDTSVCGDSWCLHPSLSPFLVEFTQILESILLDNPHKAAVLSVGCAYFSSTLFPSTQLSVNMLGYSTLWTARMFVAHPPCEGCQWLSSVQLSDQQSSPWLCSPVNQTERPFEGSGNLCMCFELISLLACHHILIRWVNWWVFVKYEPKSSQLKEPKT